MRTLTRFLLLLVCGVTTHSLVSCPQASAQDRPNIVFIMADDVGWSNPSCYHNGLMSSRTPNIDKIAKEGMRLTDY